MAENEDLLADEPVVPPEGTETEVKVDDNAGDVSPQVDVEGAKSPLEALEAGLGEVIDRRNRGTEKPDKEADAETPEQKTTREAAEAAAKVEPAKPEDKTKVEADKAKAAVDDPIPPQVAEKTRERMQTLIDLVKSKDGEIKQAQDFVDQIAATGASPQEFTTMMSYMSAVHSDNPEHLKLAQNLLMSELEAISLKLGTPAPGIDFLSKYPELLAQVERGEIRREAANEIAMNRTKVANTKVQDDQRKQATETQAATTKAHDDGMAELNKLGDELYAKDGQEYLRRYAILEPALEALGELPPKQWKAAFLRAYNAVKPAPAAVSTLNKGAPGAKSGNQPLRANKVPSGDSAPKPKNALEAMSASLAELGV